MRSKGKVRAALTGTLLLGTALAAFGAPPEIKEADYTVADFAFKDGSVLPKLRLHYATLGTPQRDAAGRISNAVLLLHGTTTSSKAFFTPGVAGELFGPGQPLDTSRYYIIVPDGVGRGGSSKPSEGLRAKFPRYGYADLVEAQHRLVEGLGIEHLKLVLGVSMGGMHAWMWAERYPTMMDAVMPIACQPTAINGRNLMFRRLLVEAIRNDPGWMGGDYQTPPQYWLNVAPLWPVILDNPVRLQAAIPDRKAALAAFQRMRDNAAKNYDANDFLYWIESSFDYDPQPELGRIKAALYAVNFADDELNPPDLEVVEKLVKTIPGARFTLVPESSKTAGHQTLNLPAVWKPYLVELLQQVEKQ